MAKSNFISTPFFLANNPSHIILLETSRSYLDHDIGAEDVRREKYPEHVIDEEACEQKSGDLQTGQSDEGYESDAQSHAHCVHEEPVSGEYPDAYYAYAQRERQQLGAREPTAYAKRYLVAIRARSDYVLTHW